MSRAFKRACAHAGEAADWLLESVHEMLLILRWLLLSRGKDGA